MLTKRMFWVTVATATAASSVFAWLMIKASDGYPSLIDIPTASKSPESVIATQPASPNGLVSKGIGLLLKAALQAIKDKDFEKAKSALAQAEASASKTPFEAYKISEVWTYFYGQQKNYRALLNGYEQMLAKSNDKQFLSPELAATVTKTMAQLAFSIGEHAKAIEFSRIWLAEHPEDSDVLTVLIGAYHTTRDFSATMDFQHCVAVNRDAISVTEQNNSRPIEHALTSLRLCASTLNDTSNVEWATERLCRYYPNRDYWKSYLRLLSWNEHSDLGSFYWTLLELDAVGKLEREAYKTLALQELTDYLLPATAQRTLELALAQRVFDTDIQIARVQLTLARAVEAAAAARASISTLVIESAADATGEKTFALGLIYFDDEQYPQAIATLSEALEKGRFKNLTHARMTLAIAYLKSGNRESARTQFATVGADPAYARLARAWLTRTYN